MRTTTLVLIVAGVVLLAVALWLATVMPVRSDVMALSKAPSESTQTRHLNLWGTELRKTFWQLYHLTDGTTREAQQEGKTLRGAYYHGPWTYRERHNKGEWKETIRWFIDGKEATEQEWNAYLRGDKP